MEKTLHPKDFIQPQDTKLTKEFIKILLDNYHYHSYHGKCDHCLLYLNVVDFGEVSPFQYLNLCPQCCINEFRNLTNLETYGKNN